MTTGMGRFRRWFGRERPGRPGRRAVLFMAGATWLAFTSRAGAAEFTIANGDEAALIAAINDANASAEADVIHLAQGGIYTLTDYADMTNGRNGLPSVTSEIVINGNGSVLRRSAGIVPHFRIIHVAATGDLTLNDLRVRNGRALDGATQHVANGGGILVLDGALTLSGCVVEDNRCGDSGFSSDMFGLNGGRGGGIYSQGGTLTIVNSTIRGNRCGNGESGTQFGGSGGDGGGIFNNGQLVLTRSTLSGNETGARGTGTTGNGSHGSGAGLYNSTSGDATVTACTFSGNVSPGAGGGILNYGQVLVSGSTIAGNSAQSGGGVHNQADLDLSNTIIAQQAAGADCGGVAPFSLGHNLDSDGSCQLSGTGDAGGVNAMLGPLADNGGPTQTHAPLAGSPAIDAGGLEAEALDQRGLRRAFDGDGSGDGEADIGAVEFYDCDGDAGEDATGDVDGDTIPDGCDACEDEDDLLDSDGDGAADCLDPCPDDASDDTDGDGVCDGADTCAGGDDGVDADGDGVPDACDDPPAGQACCGGGLPAVLPVLLLGWKRRRARPFTRIHAAARRR